MRSWINLSTIVLMTFILMGCATTQKELNSYIHNAVRKNNSNQVKSYLKQGANPNYKNEDGYTPLQVAIRNHVNPKIVKSLINAGADTEVTFPDGENLLHIALERGNPIETIELLLDKGVDPNHKNNRGQTPLFNFVREEIFYQYEYHDLNSENKTKIKLLLDRGSNINTKNKNGLTLLHLSVKKEKFDIAKFLLENGANPKIENNEGFSPYELLEKNSYPKKWIKLMSEYSDKASKTLKNWATNKLIKFIRKTKKSFGPRDETKIKQMVKSGVDPNSLNESGISPLHILSYNLVTEILLNNGGNPNLKNKDGNTPLHLSIKADLPGKVKLLIKNGGDLDIRNNNGVSPRDLISSDSYQLQAAVADAKNKYEKIDFRRLKKTPKLNRQVKLSGTVEEIKEKKKEGEIITTLRMSFYNMNDVDDSLYVVFPGRTTLLEGDDAWVYGKPSGLFNYTSVAGWNISIPKIKADIICKPFYI